MPNSRRLALLIELREAAGLSQAEMAERCGLRGRQSRKSVASWETGDSTPRRHHRRRFISYLLDDLALARDPQRFEQVWAMLVEEWNWEPLDGQERERFMEGRSAAPAVLPMQESTVPDPGAVSTFLPLPEPTDDLVGEDGPNAVQGWGQGRALLAAAFMILVVVAGVGIWQNFAVDGSAVQDKVAALVATPLSTAVGPLNLGFEDAGSTAPWQADGPCTFDLMDNAEMAWDGERLLSVTGAEDCLAIFQDFAVSGNPGTVVNFSLWVRSPDGEPRTGQLSFGTPDTALANEPGKDQGVDFTILGPVWTCVESSVVLDKPSGTNLQVRLDFAGSASHMLDGGTMRIGSTDPLCPPKLLQIQDGGFEYDAFADLWQWLPQACPSQIISDPRQAHSGSGFLRIQRPSADCQSFSQDIFGRIPPKTDYTASVWVRSVERQPIDGRLGVWVLNDAGNVGNAQLFTAGPTWQCVETRVTAADGAVGLRPEIYLDALGETVTYEFDDFQIGIGPDFGCPREPQLVDAGFEDKASVAMWQGDPTCVTVIENDATVAHAGEGFLSATKPHPDCRSIYRDLPTSLPLGQDIHIAVWARSSDSTPRRGTLALWAIGGAVNQSAKNQFQVADGQWECLETALTVTEPDLHILRFELYLDSEDEIPLLLDDATVSLSDKPLCPQVNLALRSARILPTQTRFYAGSTLSLETEVRNLGPDDATTSGVLAQWVSATEHGDPIDGNLVVRTPLPKLAANESTRVIAQDIFIPLGLRPDFDYYVVWQVDGDNQVFETNEADNRDSRKIEMTACSTADFYCDVPTGYWAEAGIELWRQHGISGGCRSGTEPFLNRPFCPDAMITRNLMAILLTRQMKGGDYRPHGEYAGTFADVPTGLPHQLELWIEELAETGIDLTGSNCPQVAGERRYCHDLPMTRADLVYTLAQLQKWNFEPITEPVFADVGENQIHAQEINHLQTLGIDISNDPNCPDLGVGPRFCPDDPVRRGFAAALMSQVFGLAPITE